MLTVFSDVVGLQSYTWIADAHFSDVLSQCWHSVDEIKHIKHNYASGTASVFTSLLSLWLDHDADKKSGFKLSPNILFIQ